MELVIQALILGIVQGLTEFLPISSSGHLILLPALLGWRDPFVDSLLFGVVLHLGTLLALLAYFARDWILVLVALVGIVRDRRIGSDPARILARNLALATLPAAVAGYLANDLVESAVRDPRLVAFLLIAGGAILFAADRLGRKTRPAASLRPAEALVIGCAQALALLPGVSRSGISISTGLLLGLDREGAARFSFLMAAPIIGGAGIFELRKAFVPGAVPEGGPLLLLVGFVAALISGLVAIRLLLRYVRTNSLDVFVAYRLVLALAVLAVLAWR